MDEDMIILDDNQEAAQPQAEENIKIQQEEVTPETPTEELPKEPTQQEFKIPVKFNHGDKELTVEEATPFIQKGMNYDKVYAKLIALENDPKLLFIEQQASKYNMTPDEFIEFAQKQEEEAQLRQLIEANIPEEYAKEMIESRKFREQQLKAQEKEKQAKAQEQKQLDEINEFISAYPDVKPEDIPKEVYEYMKQTGKPMLQAMMYHENQQLKNKIKVLETNLSNKSKAPVASATVHGSAEVAAEDEFMQGFNSI